MPLTSTMAKPCLRHGPDDPRARRHAEHLAPWALLLGGALTLKVRISLELYVSAFPDPASDATLHRKRTVYCKQSVNNHGCMQLVYCQQSFGSLHARAWPSKCIFMNASNLWLSNESNSA
jgi:hypothetical protein